MARENQAMEFLMAELRARRFHPVRIEDKSSTGTPDLNFHVRNITHSHDHVASGLGRCVHPDHNGERDIWVELKDAEGFELWRVELRPAQFAWLTEAYNAGRSVWVVFRAGTKWYAIGNPKGWTLFRSRFRLSDITRQIGQGFETVSELVDFISI